VDEKALTLRAPRKDRFARADDRVDALDDLVSAGSLGGRGPAGLACLDLERPEPGHAAGLGEGAAALTPAEGGDGDPR
jgi:hypothetical protein